MDSTAPAASVPLDGDFWHAAYQRHGGTVLRFLLYRLRRREEAEDLLQETFVRAIRADSFRPGGNLRAYLLETARNLTINRLRRPRLVETVESAGETEVDPRTSSPEQTTAWSAFRQRLDKVLDEMSEAHRTAFEMAVLQQRSYQEIAELTGWSLSAVKVNLFRARQRVIRDLGDELPEVGERVS